MIVVGVDVHKHSLTAVAVDEVGRLLRSGAGLSAERSLLAWAARLAMSGCGRSRTAGTSRGALERLLLAAGEELVRVPPRLTAPQRRAAAAR